MINFILDFFLIIFFILISFNDIKNKIIPNILTLGILGLGIIKIIFLDVNFENSFLGMGVYPLFLILIYGYLSDFLKKDVLGFGDIKLLGAIGFYFGYLDLYNLIILYNIIFILAFLYIVPFFFFKKINRNKEIPFAPFICLGSILFKILVIL